MLVVQALYLLLAVASAEVSISDNGYSGLLVGISQDTDQAEGEALIAAIKVMFRQASGALFTATDKRAYFKNVTIVLPMSWTDIKVDRESYSETYESSQIRVAPQNEAYGNNPYTLQPGGCGEPGKYVHVTPEYLQQLNTTSQRKYGPAGKVLIHEWAHLRYGVFEEYGYPGDDRYPMFYYRKQANGESELVPNVCTDTDIQGYQLDASNGGDCRYNDTTGLPNSDCFFYPYDQQDAVSSLMSYTYLDSVNHFCNSSEPRKHQADAPTKQNFRCQHRSVWEVIAAHADFSGHNNPAKNRTPSEIQPSFQIVRPAQAHFIMVLDTSGSMEPSAQTNRIKQLHSAATKWIKYELQNGTFVSVLNFTNQGQLLTDFIEIVDDESRERLASFVPSQANGGTCICNGVDLGLKTLKKKIGTGGVMVLMTDGDENKDCVNSATGKHWDLTDLYGPVVAAEVRVITMAFGKSADSRLEKFAEISDGSTYFISDSSSALDLEQAFQGCLTYQPDITVETEKSVTLFQQHFAGSSVRTFTGMFSIDPTTGREFTLKIECDDDSTKAQVKQVQLVAPGGHSYTNFTWKPDENFGTLDLEMAEEGDWIFSITFRKTAGGVVVTATSKSSGTEVVPLTAECWIGNSGTVDVTADTRLAVLARVRQGNNAVLHATVMAHVTTPSSSSKVVDMTLLDNGVGADAITDDGIYTRFFTKFSNKGRYSVVCEVKNDGKAVINKGFAASGSPQNPRVDRTHWCCGSRSPVGATTPTGNFTRIASAGAFQTSNTVNPNILPPAQVTDLALVTRTTGDREVNITWTAPGDDLDSGTAAAYEFRWSGDASDLAPASFTTHGQTVNASLVPDPEESSTQQSLELQIPGNDTTVYIAMRTRDAQKHWSPVSNIAILYLGAVPAPPGPGSGLSGGAVAGIVIAAVVLVVVSVAGALFYRRRRQRADIVRGEHSLTQLLVKHAPVQQVGSTS